MSSADQALVILISLTLNHQATTLLLQLTVSATLSASVTLTGTLTVYINYTVNVNYILTSQN